MWNGGRRRCGMVGTMTEDMSGVMRMAAVGIRERQKQRRWRHGRNERQWEINFGEERGYDVKWCDEEHGGIDALRRGWAEVEISPETEKMRCHREKKLASRNRNAHGCRFLGHSNQNIGGPRQWRAVDRPKRCPPQSERKNLNDHNAAPEIIYWDTQEEQ